MKYPIKYTPQFRDDIKALRRENAKLTAKVFELIFDIQEDPFTGLGQPEALKGNLSGWWSRRVSGKHRLIYRIKEENLELAACYGHYDDK